MVRELTLLVALVLVACASSRDLDAMDYQQRLVASGFKVGKLTSRVPPQLASVRGRTWRDVTCSPAELDGYAFQFCLVTMRDGLQAISWVSDNAHGTLPPGTHEHARGNRVVLMMPVQRVPPPAILEQVENAAIGVGENR